MNLIPLALILIIFGLAIFAFILSTHRTRELDQQIKASPNPDAQKESAVQWRHIKIFERWKTGHLMLIDGNLVLRDGSRTVFSTPLDSLKITFIDFNWGFKLEFPDHQLLRLRLINTRNKGISLANPYLSWEEAFKRSN